jgi:predicted O-methyltransferase YrrM
MQPLRNPPQVLTKQQVELGGYVGYSCILFADAVRKAGGERYFSFERDPAFAAVIMSLVDLAGLTDLVKVVVGSSDEGIARLAASNQLKGVDLMFLDHYKPAYTTDLKLCEELGLIKKGSVLAADNVIKPGNPPYLKYVRASVEEKVKEAGEGGQTNLSGIAETNVKMYEKRYGKAKFSESKGNPNLKYESKLVNSYEPTGVPVSATTGGSRTPTDWHRTVSRSHDALVRWKDHDFDGKQRIGQLVGSYVSALVGHSDSVTEYSGTRQQGARDNRLNGCMQQSKTIVQVTSLHSEAKV